MSVRSPVPPRSAERRWPPGRALLCLATLVMLAGCGQGREALPLFGGGSVALGAGDGRLTFINYWAEWCAPCREEIPALNAFAAAHPEQVRVLSVNFDAVTGEQLGAQIEALGLDFPTLLEDPRPGLGIPPPQGLPETLVLDSQGVLLRVLRGPQTRADLETIVADLMP